MSLTRTRNIPASPHTAVSHGAPETEPRMLGFGFLAQILPPGLALANAQPPFRLHVIYPHPPPPSITPHRRFTRRARNRATNARFRVFPQTPPPPPFLGEREGPPLPPPPYPS